MVKNTSAATEPTDPIVLQTPLNRGRFRPIESRQSIRMKTLVLGIIAAALAQGQSMNMDEISRGLGVQCNYCHSAARGTGTPEPKKEIARAMMEMTRDLNKKVPEATGKSAAETTQVECVTCHR